MSPLPDPSRTEFAILARQLVGGVVSKSCVGIGSMITLQVEHIGHSSYPDRVWVQLTEWAITEAEVEVVSSDLSDADFANRKDHLIQLVGKMVLNTHLFDDGEFHIDFSGRYRLETWPNQDSYGQDAPLISLFKGSDHVATLTV